MSHSSNLEMLESVARALGSDLCREVAFVGGSTTGLLLSDQLAIEETRHTEDVDIIVHVIAHLGWRQFEKRVHKLGFKPSIQEDAPICTLWLDGLRVDFMPDDETILGFSNRWYPQALDSAVWVRLPRGTDIRVVSPPYFIGTKLEAYRGRGNNDPLLSQEIEDLIAVVDGRVELTTEMLSAPLELKKYIADQLRKLMPVNAFLYAVQSFARSDSERTDEIYRRLKVLCQIGEQGSEGDPNFKRLQTLPSAHRPHRSR